VALGLNPSTTKNKNKAGMVVHAYNPRYSGSRGRKISLKSGKTYLNKKRKTEAKKIWGHDSSGRLLASLRL
jgi:hypothetical protein